MSRILILILLCLHPLAAHAQSETADVHRMRVQAFLDAIRGDAEDAKTFVQEHLAPHLRDAYPIEEHAERFRQLRDELGAFQATEWTPSPGALEVTLTSAGGAVRLLIEFDEAAPHLIRRLAIEDGPRSTSPPLGSLAELDEELRRRAADGHFSGVVLAARGDAVVFSGAYGEADRRYGEPNTLGTRFNIGSLGKDVTAVAILQLVERGLVGLDEPIGTYLDGFPEEIAGRVTVEQLLQHRSGWGDYFGDPDFHAGLAGFRSIRDYVDLARDRPLEFEPGTSRRYSNLGYEVLGGIIEAVTGRPYDEHVRESVFEPLGMRDTDAFERDLPVQRLAVGYTRQSPFGPADGLIRENIFLVPPKGTAAGGSYTTAADLLRFYRALMGGELLDPRSTAYLLSDFTSSEGSGASRANLAYSGGAPGLNAAVEADGAAGVVVVVLSNLDPPVAEELAPEVLRLVRRVGE